MRRRDFLKGAVPALTLVSASGCLTAKLYEAHDTQYDETAVSFLATEDGTTLVVLGEKYHYIFHDISPSLKQVLLSPLRKVVVADLSKFYVRRDNVVTGDYALALSEDASDEQRKRVIEAGFLTPSFTLSGHLEGVRYSAEKFPPVAQTLQFDRPYVVTITEQEPASGARLAGKILLTPITVAADGVLVLGGVLLVLLVCGYGRCY